MVKVENNLWILATELLSICYSTLSHVAEDCWVGILACAL